MTAQLSRLLPLVAVAAIFAGVALALAAVSGAAASDEGDHLRNAQDIMPGECQDGRCGPGGRDDVAATCAEEVAVCNDTVDVGAPDIAPMCIEGPAADCVATTKPGDAIADCETGTDPCYDTGVAPPAGKLDDRCKQIADDLIACIADPDAPVSSDGPLEKPAEPPDGTVSEPNPGEGSPPDAGQLAEDIAAREECKVTGVCD